MCDRPPGGPPLSVHPTCEAAMASARQGLAETGGGELVVWGPDGRVIWREDVPAAADGGDG